jgi:hypothetical protein
MQKFTRRNVTVLLLVLIFGYAALEVLSYVRMHRGSGRGSRIMKEYREAIALTPTAANGSPTVLMVGNSLIREGVDMTALRAAAGGHYDLHRLVIESTAYNDWVVAIPALLQEGARPSVIMLTISPLQMNSHAAVSMETTHYLLNNTEVVDLVHRDGSGLNGYVGHFIEHISPLWGTRNSAQVAFKDIIPGYRSIVYAIANEPVPPLNFDPVRMEELARACRQYNVKLVYLAMPANNPNGAYDAERIHRAADQYGVRFMRPVADDELHGDQYTDLIHLSPSGRAYFMPRFLAALPAAVN